VIENNDAFGTDRSSYELGDIAIELRADGGTNAM
jgi:hypothetical protein